MFAFRGVVFNDIFFPNGYSQRKFIHVFQLLSFLDTDWDIKEAFDMHTLSYLEASLVTAGYSDT